MFPGLMHRFFLFFPALLALAWPLISPGQKYDFVNYSIEEGLVQSQVNNTAQDQYGMLWISTYGGISRFDGNTFTNFNYGNGLMHSLTSRVFVDDQNTVWIGTEAGLQAYDGKGFRTIGIAPDNRRRHVNDLAQAPDGSIIALLSGWQLFKLNPGSQLLEAFSDTAVSVTAVAADTSGLYAAFAKKGIYKWSGGQWQVFCPFTPADSGIVIRKMMWSRSGKGLWVIGRGALFSCEQGRLVKKNTGIPSPVLCLEEDPAGDLYLGTTRGAYKLSPGQSAEHIGLLQGLTDNAVFHIFRDREENLWFSTDGNGIFKFHDRSFRIYDRGSGLSGSIIMGLARDHENNYWAGSLENGLSVIRDKTIRNIKLPTGKTEASKIVCVFVDAGQSVWIGTSGDGLWRYRNNKFERVGWDTPRFPRHFTSINQDSRGVIWLTSPMTVSRIENGLPIPMPGVYLSCFSTFEINPDTLLLGTAQGLFSINRQYELKPFEVPGTQGFVIGSINRWGDLLVFGTSENGLVVWDPQTGKSYVCNEKNGLSSNMTFSVLPDGASLYVGTINGLNKVGFDKISGTFQVRPLKSANQKLGPECNQNAILKDPEGRIWAGTTKGIYIYDPKPAAPLLPPRLFLKSLTIHSQLPDSTMGTDSLAAWYRIPRELRLKHRQNHLSFSLIAVHLTAPEKLRYQYFLSGADTVYSAPDPVPSVIYPNLAPGDYTFRARALLDSDPPIYSSELAYPFSIKPPFYQTNWFRLLAVLFLLLTGAVIQKIRMVLRARQQRLLKEARMQEQLLIQQRTSEDLHDDLGNKITRLSLLTDILQTKLGGNEEQHKLMAQIRENIQGLYMGTKDIIWALAPGNNSLMDVAGRIQNFGTELFQDSRITFKSCPPDPSFEEIKPPFEYSRNLIMICKEAFGNILKHSGATHASIEFSLQPSSIFDGTGLTVEIRDNGIGMPENQGMKKGYGLDNMQKRIARVGGQIQFLPNTPQGTLIRIRIKIPRTVG